MPVDTGQCTYQVVASPIRSASGETVISTTVYLDALSASVSLKQTGRYLRIRIYKISKTRLQEWYY